MPRRQHPAGRAFAIREAEADAAAEAKRAKKLGVLLDIPESPEQTFAEFNELLPFGDPRSIPGTEEHRIYHEQRENERRFTQLARKWFTDAKELL